MTTKNSSGTIGNGTRNLQAYSAVPQLTVTSRTINPTNSNINRVTVDLPILLSLHYVRSMDICPGYVCLYCRVHVEVLQWVDSLPKDSCQKLKKK